MNLQYPNASLMLCGILCRGRCSRCQRGWRAWVTLSFFFLKVKSLASVSQPVSCVVKQEKVGVSLPSWIISSDWDEAEIKGSS